VAEAIGDASIEYNNERFCGDLERQHGRGPVPETGFEYIDEHWEDYEDVLEWFEKTWEAIEQAGYFEDSWPHPAREGSTISVT